jgi:hypothetical protein
VGGEGGKSLAYLGEDHTHLLNVRCWMRAHRSCPAECGAAVSGLLSHCASFVAENMPVQHEQLERLQRRCEHAHRLANAHGGDGSGGTTCDCSAAALSALKKSTVMKGLDARVARLESAAAPQKHTSNGGTAGAGGGGGQCADLEARLEKLEKTRQLLTPPADAAPAVTSGSTAMPDEMLRLREKVRPLRLWDRLTVTMVLTEVWLCALLLPARLHG